jgi:hypothetical protein
MGRSALHKPPSPWSPLFLQQLDDSTADFACSGRVDGRSSQYRQTPHPSFSGRKTPAVSEVGEQVCVWLSGEYRERSVGAAAWPGAEARLLLRRVLHGLKPVASTVASLRRGPLRGASVRPEKISRKCGMCGKHRSNGQFSRMCGFCRGYGHGCR